MLPGRPSLGRGMCTAQRGSALQMPGAGGRGLGHSQGRLPTARTSPIQRTPEGPCRAAGGRARGRGHARPPRGLGAPGLGSRDRGIALGASRPGEPPDLSVAVPARVQAGRTERLPPGRRGHRGHRGACVSRQGRPEAGAAQEGPGAPPAPRPPPLRVPRLGAPSCRLSPRGARGLPPGDESQPDWPCGVMCPPLSQSPRPRGGALRWAGPKEVISPSVRRRRPVREPWRRGCRVVCTRGRRAAPCLVRACSQVPGRRRRAAHRPAAARACLAPAPWPRASDPAPQRVNVLTRPTLAAPGDSSLCCLP